MSLLRQFPAHKCNVLIFLQVGHEVVWHVASVVVQHINGAPCFFDGRNSLHSQSTSYHHSEEQSCGSHKVGVSSSVHL